MATFKFTMTFEMTETHLRFLLSEADIHGDLDVDAIGGIDRIVAFLKTTAAVTQKGYEVNDPNLATTEADVVVAVVEEAKDNGEFDEDEPERHPEAAVKAALEKWEDEGHKDSDWEAVLAVAPWADLKSLDFREKHAEDGENPWFMAEYVACRHCGYAPIQEEADGGCPVYGHSHFA